MSGTGTARPWQVWRCRPGFPLENLRQYGTRAAAIRAAAAWNLRARDAGMPHSYVVVKRP